MATQIKLTAPRQRRLVEGQSGRPIKTGKIIDDIGEFRLTLLRKKILIVNPLPRKSGQYRAP